MKKGQELRFGVRGWGCQAPEPQTVAFSILKTDIGLSLESGGREDGGKGT